ncbi:MAG: exonuclease SbcCD subunit D C-terminal domain-containing protein [Desulfobacterales bacterium]|nr:exonuclease SbcCD subunit D C-terminal domain-containing protein [Desulfobacterales bacterium]
MFKLIHTADWHLGHKLDKFDRTHEHEHFFDWLLTHIQEHEIDGILICGDLFDSSNPSIQAMKLFFDFILQAKQYCPNIVITAGNHDSAARLDAFRSLLHALGIYIIGSIPDNLNDCILPLYNRNQELSAYVVAVPYIRPMDLPPPPVLENGNQSQQRIISGISDIYSKLLASTVSQQSYSRVPIIVTGHLFMVGSQQTSESERPIQLEVGNIQGIPVDIFSKDVDYVALGHLHRSQRISYSCPIYYSGSPLILSFAETDYVHQVLEVQFHEDGKQPVIIPVPVPVLVKMYDISGSFDRICELLNDLAIQYPLFQADEARVRVTITEHEPKTGIKGQILDSVKDSRINILGIRIQGNNHCFSTQQETENRQLVDLSPIDVFRSMYYEKYPQSELPNELQQAFLEILESATQILESM